MIEVKDLVKRYGGHCAVDHLSFTVEDGCICGFLGPNGAGKSTTMNIITGYMGATEGQVRIDGHDILKEPEEAKKAIGYLPEIPPLYTDMTVEEYLQFAAQLKQVPKAEREEQIDRIISLTHLEEVQWRLIKNLSKGYRQRVGLAQALLGFPKTLILDEPMVGLDPKQILEIRELIRTLAKEHTVFLSSHILSEIQELCDRILILDHGKLLANDTPEHLEQALAGGQTLQLEVKGSRTQVEELLRAFPALQIRTAQEQDGITRLELHCSEEADPREQLSYAFAQAHCPILTMQAAATSLEQVFLQLTGGDAQQPEKEGSEQ